MSNISDIKKRLSMSTTLPAGTGGDSSAQWMMGSAHSHNHHHEHNADGSCCGHDHSHDEIHDHDDDDDHECDEDSTNPSGGCC